MHFITLRERGSKIYSDTVYNIPISNDRSHIIMSQNKVEETKVVQQKRQIDKMMHGIIKERMFSHFIDQDTRISDENYSKITGICKKRYFQSRLKSKNQQVIPSISKTIDVAASRKFSQPKRQVNFSTTIQCFPTTKQTYSVQKPIFQSLSRRPFMSEARQRRESLRLPDLERTETAKTIKSKGNLMVAHHKKLQFNERIFADTFRRWAGGNSQVIVNQLKVSRQTIISKLKNYIDSATLEKFFYFFSFPQLLNIRQYGNLVENAANCSLRFIYFWMFIVLDENSNGMLTSQELFHLLQRYPDNDYIEEEIFLLGKYIDRMEKHPFDKAQIEIPAEESLTVNRNLKMDELKDILKQSTKERIEVNCVKNTCYHQTVLSLQHDPLQRAKLSQIQSNEQLTKKMKEKKKEEKKKNQNLLGLRLRDFPHVFGGKRPKIFCYVLHLLTGLRPQDYQ